MRWLGAGANDKASHQEVGPKWRLPGAVGADRLQEGDIQRGAQKEAKDGRHTPGDDRRQR